MQENQNNIIIDNYNNNNNNNPPDKVLINPYDLQRRFNNNKNFTLLCLYCLFLIILILYFFKFLGEYFPQSSYFDFQFALDD